jgi:hypothetical protein
MANPNPWGRGRSIDARTRPDGPPLDGAAPGGPIAQGVVTEQAVAFGDDAYDACDAWRDAPMGLGVPGCWSGLLDFCRQL